MKFILISLIPFFFLLTSCDSQTNSSTVANGKHIGKVNQTDFAAKLNATPNAQLIDVRRPDEFIEGRLERAVNLNYYDKDFSEQIAKLDKDRPVFIYCKSGGRSGKATKKMAKMGFKEVYDLRGGYDGWTSK